MYNTTNESDCDVDLGSGGALVLPDMTDAAARCSIWRSERARMATFIWWIATTWASSTRKTTAQFIRSWTVRCRAESGRCRRITRAGFISARWAVPYRRFSSARRSSRPLPLRRLPRRFLIPAPRPAFRRMARYERHPLGGGEQLNRGAARLLGQQSGAGALQHAARRPRDATTSARATSSWCQPSPTAKYMWGRRTAWRRSACSANELSQCRPARINA